VKPNRKNLLLAATISLALASPSAFAAALSWTGGSGDWQTGFQGGWSATWNNSDTGTFNGAGGTVTVKSAITTGNAALAFTAGNYTLQSDGATERIITLGNASITLGNGVTTALGSKATFARAGAITFDGNSKATSTLNIDSNGRVAATGSANNITIQEATANVNSGGAASSEGSLVVGATVDGASFNVLGGTVTVGSVNADANIVLGNFNGVSTTNLKITSGSLGFATAGNQHGIRVGRLDNTGTATGIVDLEGGIVTVRRIFEQNSAQISTVNLHGGTLKALIDWADFLAVDKIWVKSGGAIFDTNGKAITVTKALETDPVSTGGGLTLNDTAAIKGSLTLSATPTYTGPTMVTAGKLVVPSSHVGTGALTVSANATLVVNVSGTSQWQPASLTLANPCTLEFNSLQNPGTTNAPLAPTTAVGTVSGVTLHLKSISGAPVPGNSYPLLANAGSTTGYTLGTQPTGVTGSLAINGTTLVYIVQSVSAIWTGADGANPTFWDIATTANWTAKALNNTPTGTYADGDDLLFDDTATPASPVAVAIQTAVAPGNMVFSSNKAYTIGGAFGIGGNGTLTKSGSGTLTLGTDNSYTGDTIVNGGILSITQNNALGTTAGNKTIINGGTAGGTIVGNALRFSSATTGLTIGEAIELTPNSTGRASLGNDTSNALNHTFNGNITINGASNVANIFSRDGGGSVTINGDISGSISTANQRLLLRGSSGETIINKVTGNISLTGGTVLQVTQDNDSVVWEIGGPGKTFSAAAIRIANGKLQIASAAGDNYIASSTLLDFEGNSNAGTLELNGTKQTVAGIVTSGAAGGAKFITSSVAGGQLTVNNATDYDTTTKVRLTGQLALVKTGSAKLTLPGENTYSGDTTVSQGILSFSPATAPDPANANPNNDASMVTIAPGAVLDLAFTGTDKVDKLFFGATPQPSGTYSSSGVPAGATMTTSSFSGGGTLTVGGGFSSWITGTFAGGATVPALQQGPNDDPDNDGIRNLVEYAIAGQDPTVGNPTIGTFNGTILSFDKRLPLATDITYTIQDSTDLGLSDAWAEVNNTPPNIYVNNGTTVSYALTPGTPPRNFIRLQVSQP
jgi:autotransporter-associated beta strand protein